MQWWYYEIKKCISDCRRAMLGLMWVFKFSIQFWSRTVFDDDIHGCKSTTDSAIPIWDMNHTS